jgi:hypothetical protein
MPSPLPFAEILTVLRVNLYTTYVRDVGSIDSRPFRRLKARIESILALTPAPK